eukprot:3022371-Rhodomonas_salina.1
MSAYTLLERDRKRRCCIRLRLRPRQTPSRLTWKRSAGIGVRSQGQSEICRDRGLWSSGTRWDGAIRLRFGGLVPFAIAVRAAERTLMGSSASL